MYYYVGVKHDKKLMVGIIQHLTCLTKCHQHIVYIDKNKLQFNTFESLEHVYMCWTYEDNALFDLIIIIMMTWKYFHLFEQE